MINNFFKTSISKVIIYFLLIISGALFLFPFFWMVIGATSESGEILSMPPSFLPGKNLLNNIINLEQSINIMKVVFNSLFIAIVFTILSLLITSMAGYAFAKFNFRGRDILFFILLLAIMIPYHITLVPLFEIFVELDWLNTYKSVILPQLAYPFAIFLMRQNMLSFPDAVIEAARIDGAGEFKIFFKIVLPAMKPALSALAIFLLMFQWNNFLWPMIMLNSSEMYTLPVALSSLIGFSRVDYGQLMLLSAISVLPIVLIFLLLQKQFVSGILGGSVKE